MAVDWPGNNNEAIQYQQDRRNDDLAEHSRLPAGGKSGGHSIVKAAPGGFTEPWMAALTQMPDLASFCRLAGSSLDVSDVCNRLLDDGYDRKAVSEALNSYTKNGVSLVAFFRQLSEKLDVTIELRAINGQGAITDCVRFKNGENPSFYRSGGEGALPPLDGNGLIRFTLRQGPQGWQWHFPMGNGGTSLGWQANEAKKLTVGVGEEFVLPTDHEKQLFSVELGEEDDGSEVKDSVAVSSEIKHSESENETNKPV